MGLKGFGLWRLGVGFSTFYHLRAPVVEELSGTAIAVVAARAAAASASASAPPAYCSLLRFLELLLYSPEELLHILVILGLRRVLAA